MEVVRRVDELRRLLAGETQAAFVPTMGNLHDGHIALVHQAREVGRPVVASIFVNPLQFGQGEDFERYPRTLGADCARLKAAGTDIVFAPEVAEVYPEPQSFMVLPPHADDLCGAFRPGHFQGVCTVVLKLFAMVRPSVAVFGKKDYQQIFLIRTMVRQFNLGIEILAGETVRAADGLALSSRNAYLDTAERVEAASLYTELKRIETALRTGARDLHGIEAASRDRLEARGWRVDYIAVRGPSTLLSPEPGASHFVVLGAARLGRTRLIDNLEVTLT